MEYTPQQLKEMLKSDRFLSLERITAYSGKPPDFQYNGKEYIMRMQSRRTENDPAYWDEFYTTHVATNKYVFIITPGKYQELIQSLES